MKDRRETLVSDEKPLQAQLGFLVLQGDSVYADIQLPVLFSGSLDRCTHCAGADLQSQDQAVIQRVAAIFEETDDILGTQ